MNTSGIRPSSRICDGWKLGFHCCRTMRVRSKPDEAIVLEHLKHADGNEGEREDAHGFLQNKDRGACVLNNEVTVFSLQPQA